MSLFLFQLGNELKKLFARKRTYIGFGTFIAVEALILFWLHLPKPSAFFRRVIEQNGYVFEQYFSGLTLGLLILIWTFFLDALYLALVAGDVISKEVEDGTMRMMLCRPISRGRIVLLKYLACAIYTFVLIGFIGLSALLVGIVYKGYGNLLAFDPMQGLYALHEAGAGMKRYLGALLLLALCLMTITSMGFMFSCFNMKPATATIVTLSIFFFDWVFHNIPYFESLHAWFINTHMSTWLHVFEGYIPVWQIIEDYGYLVALDATFVILGLAVFHRRDFKS
jgi:ABC-2 type transport system permease protein